MFLIRYGCHSNLFWDAVFLHQRVAEHEGGQFVISNYSFPDAVYRAYNFCISISQWSEFCSWSSLLVSFLRVPSTVYLSHIFSFLIKYLWTGSRDWVSSFICNFRSLQEWELSCANKLFLEDRNFWDYGLVIFHIILSMRWQHSGITCSQWCLSLLQTYLYHEIFGKKIVGLDCSEWYF